MNTKPSWKKKRDTIIILIPCVILLFISISGVVRVAHDSLLYIESAHWDTATTTITAVGIDSAGYWPHIEYLPEVQYEFLVNGDTYTGNQFSIPSYRTVERQDVESQISPYAVGTIVPVYYDPRDPKTSSITKPYLDYATFFYGFMYLGLLGLSLFLSKTVIKRGLRFGA